MCVRCLRQALTTWDIREGFRIPGVIGFMAEAPTNPGRLLGMISNRAVQNLSILRVNKAAPLIGQRVEHQWSGQIATPVSRRNACVDASCVRLKFRKSMAMKACRVTETS